MELEKMVGRKIISFVPEEDGTFNIYLDNNTYLHFTSAGATVGCELKEEKLKTYMCNFHYGQSTFYTEVKVGYLSEGLSLEGYLEDISSVKIKKELGIDVYDLKETPWFEAELREE